MAPSESCMTSVGSSAPRFGSISRREKRDRIGGRVKALCEAARDGGGADVIGDVALKLGGRQAERPVSFGQGVAGMIADEAGRRR